MTSTAPFIVEKMRRQLRRDTPCEMLIRRRLHALGLRYRVDVRPERSVRRRADVVFSKQKIAVFIDGCFWHACPLHASWPKDNGDWWCQKLSRNRERDVETTQLLEACGWTVLRFWEHDDPKHAVRTIAATVRSGRNANLRRGANRLGR